MYRSFRIPKLTVLVLGIGMWDLRLGFRTSGEGFSVRLFLAQGVVLGSALGAITLNPGGPSASAETLAVLNLHWFHFSADLEPHASPGLSERAPNA